MGQRGPAPGDETLFAAAKLPALRTAVRELSWLLSHGYKRPSSLKLVGDRHALDARQRNAVERCACTDHERVARRGRRADRVRGVVHVDGLNAIIVAESVLGGGPVFVGRDGAHRDLAGVRGGYRRVRQTDEVLEILAAVLAPADEVVAYLDRPVSNSGRLAGRLRELGWVAELVPDPDAVLERSDALVATGDARILDAPVRWIDLPAEVAARHADRAWILDLSDEAR